MGPPPGYVYQIVEGVRRATAARRYGLETFPAVLIGDDGLDLGPPFEVRLDLLYSTKKSVERFDVNSRYHDIEVGMTDPAERAEIPPIVVKLQLDWLARLLTPLRNVELRE